MPTHAEQRILPHRPDQMFDLVADVGRYPEFLPWCIGARVRSQTDTLLIADLIIGFKGIRESFTSHVSLNRNDMTIDVSYQDGPFKYLNNNWKFRSIESDHCTLDFYVDFEFKSRIMQRLIEMLFGEAVRRMVRAFEERAASLYG
ncbi:MAG: type II toxin-antitoxin system RatA family toxin [Alphaproteobacteria bacterium]|nr:type II toxin-antitoxin system RatA family toxin [Alphaproteobacteria bacterium]